MTIQEIWDEHRLAVVLYFCFTLVASPFTVGSAISIRTTAEFLFWSFVGVFFYPVVLIGVLVLNFEYMADARSLFRGGRRF